MVDGEVNLSVDREIEEDCRSWRGGRMRRILALPGFTGTRRTRT
jgi:hypothetical protein